MEKQLPVYGSLKYFVQKQMVLHDMVLIYLRVFQQKPSVGVKQENMVCQCKMVAKNSL